MEQYGNNIQRVSTTFTTTGTTTLVNTSTEIQVFTGASTQTIVLPVATTYTAPGAKFEFYNNSSAALTLQYSDSTFFQNIPSNSTLIVKCISNSTADGTWVTLTNSTLNPTSYTRTINAQTGTTYTLGLTDGSAAGNSPLVTFGNASATTVTVPNNSSTAFPIGTQIDCIQVGAGSVTFSPASGVTVNAYGGLVIGSQYVGVSLIKIATNTWVLSGFLT